MAEATVPYGRKTQRAPAVKEVHVLWITAGLSCDGDSVSITAATQPSIEDVVLGAIPGLPKVHLHNPVLAYENGDEFMKFWYLRRRGPARPVRPRRRGLDPQRDDQERGLLGRARHRHEDRPADHDLRVDRPPRAQGRGPWSRPAPARPTAASTRWPGNPTGCMGLADYLGWNWRSKAGLPIVNVPGCPVQPDNFMETLLYLLYQAAGLAPMIPLDDALRPTWLFGKTVHEGCDRAGYYEQARLRPRVRLAQVPGEARLLGAGRQLQRPQARLDGRHRRLPQRRRHLHRLHHARLPRQVHAVHGRAARAAISRRRPIGDLRPGHPHAPRRSPTPRPTRNRSGGTARPELTTGYHPTTYDPALEKERHDGDRHQARARDARRESGNLVEMSWDPITRIVGSLGIYTKIDFANRAGRRVPQHLVDLPRLQHLHEGQGPARRPLHHQPDLRHLRRQPRHLRRATPRTWPSASARRRMAEWIVNLGEAAEYMFDHNIFQDNLVGVDFCEQMVKETNPGVLRARPSGPRRRTPALHGYRTIADIMRSLNPFTGALLPRSAADEPA